MAAAAGKIQKLERGTNKTVGKTVEAVDTASQALELKIAKAAQALYTRFTSINIPDGDNVQGSTPWQNKINHEINAETINPILDDLGLDRYSAQDAVRFFDEEASYYKMNPDHYALEDLKNFGVDNNIKQELRAISSIAHKDYIRKHVLEAVKTAIPEDAEKRKKQVSFLAFSFANAKLLLGSTSYPLPRELYRELVIQGVKNSNPLPLIFLKELAGIELSEIFGDRHADAFAQLQADADSNLSQHLGQYWTN